MKGKSVFALVILLLSASVSAEEGLHIGSTELIFATVKEGKDILTRRDEYAEGMSPFDLSAKMKTDQNVTQADYLEFVGENVLAWAEADKVSIVSNFEVIRGNLERFSLPLPKRVFIIKTTGNEEGGAAYTRVVLPTKIRHPN